MRGKRLLACRYGRYIRAKDRIRAFPHPAAIGADLGTLDIFLNIVIDKTIKHFIVKQNNNVRPQPCGRLLVRRLRTTMTNLKPKPKAAREQTAKAKLRKYGLSRLSPKVRLKAGGIIECDFPEKKSK